MMTTRQYDNLTLAQAIDECIIDTVVASMDPSWYKPLEEGDDIEDLDVPIPGERHNWVRRTVTVTAAHIEAAQRRMSGE